MNSFGSLVRKPSRWIHSNDFYWRLFMKPWRMVSFQRSRIINYGKIEHLQNVLSAGITLDEISGTQTSVYCGSFTNDYHIMMTRELAQYPKYAVTGNGDAMLSNRISYCYNLHGPSL